MATAKRRKIPCKNNRRHGRKREKHSQVCIRPHKKELEAAKAAAREKYVTDAARTAGDLQHYSRHVPYFPKN